MIRFSSKGLAPRQILCFDMEARPLGWFGGDFTHKEVTMISSAWVDHPQTMHTYILTKRDGSGVRMVKEFLKRYDAADIVVGHYILLRLAAPQRHLFRPRLAAYLAEAGA